jgi:cytochrome c peroxidase
MNMPLDTLIERLNKVEGYTTLFNKLFNNGITADNIAKAIATFERTVVSGAAPFDRWIDGDESAISKQAKEGFMLFNGKARCSVCHSGWNFTDDKFHDIGLQTEDIGRFELDNTNVLNMHAFKTPGLRNISQRAPYMHNGSIQTLQHVLIHYMSGGMSRESLSPEMKPLALTSEDMNALTEFLKTLQGKDKPMTLPVLPL